MNTKESLNQLIPLLLLVYLLHFILSDEPLEPPLEERERERGGNREKEGERERRDSQRRIEKCWSNSNHKSRNALKGRKPRGREENIVVPSSQTIISRIFLHAWFGSVNFREHISPNFLKYEIGAKATESAFLDDMILNSFAPLIL